MISEHPILSQQRSSSLLRAPELVRATLFQLEDAEVGSSLTDGLLPSSALQALVRKASRGLPIGWFPVHARLHDDCFSRSIMPALMGQPAA